MKRLWRWVTTIECPVCWRRFSRFGERHGIGGSFCSGKCHENAWGEFLGTYTIPPRPGGTDD